MYFDVDFSPTHAGLSTVGYWVVDTDGNIVIPRTTDGVHHISHGKYAANVDLLSTFEGTILWNTYDGSSISASERIVPEVVPALPVGLPQIGVTTLSQWIAYFGAWTINEVEADSNTEEIRLRNTADDGNIAVHPYTDEGGVFTNGAAGP